jgi:ABC-type phosphate/phosphonate transport system ATPase subunit
VQLLQEPENAGLFGLSYVMWTIIVAVVMMAVAVKLSKSKKKPKNIIAIVGERFSGKTQLFININEGKKLRTVPSIHNNKTPFKLGNKNYEMVDYIGDNISK